jgi:hypothetical protein
MYFGYMEQFRHDQNVLVIYDILEWGTVFDAIVYFIALGAGRTRKQLQASKANNDCTHPKAPIQVLEQLS